MIKRVYLFTFKFEANDKGVTTHQFHLTQNAWFLDFPSIWDYAIEYAKTYNNVDAVECTMCVKL